jgi:hypothetical protein
MWKRETFTLPDADQSSMVGEVRRRKAKEPCMHGDSLSLSSGLSWSLERWTDAWRVGIARNKVEKHASLLVTGSDDDEVTKMAIRTLC